MSLQQRLRGVEPSPSNATAPTLAEVYPILANRRRRFAIHYLQYHRRPVLLGTLAEQIAAWENDVSLAAVTSKQRKALYTALQQRHVPKMAAIGLVEFDRRQGLVTPTDVLDDIRIYTEIVAGRGFPWSYYYLGLSGVLAAIAAASWLDVLPVALLPPVALQVFGVVALTASALAHVYLTHRVQLGTDSEPPELRYRAAGETDAAIDRNTPDDSPTAGAGETARADRGRTR